VRARHRIREILRSAGAPMDDANLNRRQTIRVGPGVAYAQFGIVGFDGPIDLQALRLYGLPETAPAVLNGAPLLSFQLPTFLLHGVCSEHHVCQA
jgi:hypothetical protein